MLASSREKEHSGSHFGGTRIEITIQSLEGVRLNSQFSTGPEEDEEVKASVAFTGSATNMEVVSSSICASTGQLLVESSPLPVPEIVDKEEELPLLTIEWPEFQMPQQAKPLAHLAVHLPHRDPTLPKVPLSKSNKGSRIVKEIPSLDELATNSTASCSTKSDGNTPPVPEESESYSHPHKPERLVRMRSGSVIWSNSGAAAMPEIVELTVRVQRGCRLSSEGMAYLVLFAHEDDYGTKWMDLPIQPLGGKKHDSSHLSFSQEAHLRVKIKVFPETKQPDLTAATVSSSISSSSSTEIVSNIQYSKAYLEAQIAPLMEKIRENQKLAENFLEAQRHAMEIHVPAADNEAAAAAAATTSGCRVKWSWRKVVRTLQHAMSCHGGSSSVALGIPGSSASVGSSIVTSDSMDLY